MHNKYLGLEISFVGIHTPNLVVLEACQCHIDGNFPVVPGAVSVIASCLIATSTLIWLYCFVSWRRMASRYDHTENREALKAYMKHFTEGNVDAIMELLVSASLKPPKPFYPTGPFLKICEHQSAEAWRKVGCVHNYQVPIQWHSLMHSSRVQVLILTPLPQRSIPGLLSAVQAAQQSHWSRHWWWQLEIHLWQPHDNWGANIHCFVMIFP